MASCDLDFDLENDLNIEILARLRAAVSDGTPGEANDIEEHNEPLQTVRCHTLTNNNGAVQCATDTTSTNGLPTIAPPVQCLPDTSTNGLPTVASIDGDSVVSGRSSRSEGNRRPSLQDHRSNGFLELPNDLLNFYSTVTQISPNNNTACHLGSGISDSSTDDVAIGSTNTDDVDIGALNITDTSMKDKQQTEAIGDCSLIDLDSGDASCDNVSYPGHNSTGNRRVRRSLGASTSHVTSAVSSVVDLPYKADVLPVEASDPTRSADCTTRSDSFDGGAQRSNQSAGNVTPRMAQRSRNIVNRSHSVASCSDMHHRRTPPTVPCSRSSSMKSSPPPAYRRHDPHLTLNNLPSYTASTPPLASNTQNLPVAQPAYYPQHSPSYQRHAPTSRGHQSPASHTSPGSPATSRCTAVNNSLSASSPVQYSATYQRSPGNTASFHHHGTAAHVGGPHGGPHGGVQRPTSSPAGCHFSPRSPGGAAMRTGSGTGSPQLARASMSDYLPSYEEAVGLVPPRGTQTPPNQPASSQPASPPPNDSPVATATSPPTTRCGNSSSTKLPSPPSVQPPPGPINEPPLGYAPLQFKDFTPQVVGAFFPVWEKFDVLIGRANQWLYSTHGIRVRRCESVLGMAARSHGYNPSRAIGTVSKINSDYTYNMRFLRVWYETGGSSGMVSKLIYRNLTASNMLATTSVLIALLNRDIKHAQWMNGTLVSIESVALPLKQLSHPDDCVYVERVGDVIPMAYFLRVFGVQTFDDGGQVPPVPIGTVGFLDFVPQESQSGGPHNVEPFSMLIRKVNSWMTHERPRVHLLNIQSMQVKRKANQSSYWQRLHYTYYASDKRTLRKTFFTQIVRVYFMTSPCLYTIPVNDPQPITYKVFTPVQLTSPKSEELKFESLEKTVERIHIWLSFQSGLRVISMETVSVRMYTGGQDRHGPETCLSWCEGRTYSDHEHWINCIRLYMRGSYRELEPWQLPIEPNVRPYTNCQPPASITLIRPTIVFP